MKHQYVYKGKPIAVIETDEIRAHVSGNVRTINGREYTITKAIFLVSEHMYIVDVIDYKLKKTTARRNARRSFGANARLAFYFNFRFTYASAYDTSSPSSYLSTFSCFDVNVPSVTARLIISRAACRPVSFNFISSSSFGSTFV